MEEAGGVPEVEHKNDRTMNIGQRIYEVMREKGRSAAWLASQIPCERSNIYNVFRRKSVGVDLLFIFSSLLHHDFFAELSQEWRQQEAAKNAGAPEERQRCV